MKKISVIFVVLCVASGIAYFAHTSKKELILTTQLSDTQEKANMPASRKETGALPIPTIETPTVADVSLETQKASTTTPEPKIVTPPTLTANNLTIHKKAPMDKNIPLDTTSIASIANAHINITSLDDATALITALYPKSYAAFIATTAGSINADISVIASPEFLAEFVSSSAIERPATAYSITYPTPTTAMITFTAGGEKIRGALLTQSGGHWYIVTPEEILFYEDFLSEKVTEYQARLTLRVSQSSLDLNKTPIPLTVRLTTSGQWSGEAPKTKTVEFTPEAEDFAAGNDQFFFSSGFLLPDSLKNTPIVVEIVEGSPEGGTLNFAVLDPDVWDGSTIVEIENKEIIPGKEYTLTIPK